MVRWKGGMGGGMERRFEMVVRDGGMDWWHEMVIGDGAVG